MITDWQRAALSDLFEPGLPADAADLSDVVSDLIVLADLKFDSYERYPPLTTFWDWLIVWLRQAAPADRAPMLRWLREHLLFVSREQVRSLFHVFADEWLMSRCMELAGPAARDVDAALRGTAVCALSDGVPMGALRRATPQLAHDQFWSDPGSLLAARPEVGHLVLIDDFSGTGKSLAYVKADGSRVGRIFDVCRTPWGRARATAMTISVVLLMATEASVRHLTGILSALGYGPHVIQVLPSRTDEMMRAWSRRYLGLSPDPAVKTDVNAGYRMGDMPVVLHHNTPNDSYALLWSSVGADDRAWRPLFPRFERIRGAGG